MRRPATRIGPPCAARTSLRNAQLVPSENQWDHAKATSRFNPAMHISTYAQHNICATHDAGQSMNEDCERNRYSKLSLRLNFGRPRPNICEGHPMLVQGVIKQQAASKPQAASNRHHAFVYQQPFCLGTRLDVCQIGSTSAHIHQI